MIYWSLFVQDFVLLSFASLVKVKDDDGSQKLIYISPSLN